MDLPEMTHTPCQFRAPSKAPVQLLLNPLKFVGGAAEIERHGAAGVIDLADLVADPVALPGAAADRLQGGRSKGRDRPAGAGELPYCGVLDFDNYRQPPRRGSCHGKHRTHGQGGQPSWQRLPSSACCKQASGEQWQRYEEHREQREDVGKEQQRRADAEHPLRRPPLSTTDCNKKNDQSWTEDTNIDGKVKSGLTE